MVLAIVTGLTSRRNYEDPNPPTKFTPHLRPRISPSMAYGDVRQPSEDLSERLKSEAGERRRRPMMVRFLGEDAG